MSQSVEAQSIPIAEIAANKGFKTDSQTHDGHSMVAEDSHISGIRDKDRDETICARDNFNDLPTTLTTRPPCVEALLLLGWQEHAIMTPQVLTRLRALLPNGVNRDRLRDAHLVAKSRNATSPGYVLTVYQNAEQGAPASRRVARKHTQGKFDPLAHILGGYGHG